MPSITPQKKKLDFHEFEKTDIIVRTKFTQDAYAPLKHNIIHVSIK